MPLSLFVSKYASEFGLLADSFLFLSGFILLIDFAPRDLFPGFRKQRKAVEALRKNKNLLFDLPSDIDVKAGSDSMSIKTDPISTGLLLQLVRGRSSLAHTVKWDRVIGIGYSTLSLPVGSCTLNAFHPLYVAVMPEYDSSEFDLVPVGQLEDLDKWLSTWRMRSLTMFAAILLTVGFLLQLIIRLFVSK
jgi:hypothetical protein